MATNAARIKSLIEQSGLSYQELENLTGIKKSSLQRYAAGITAKIPTDVLEKLSVTFNVSPLYLLGLDDTPPQQKLTDLELQLLQLYRKLPADKQNALIPLLENLIAFLK